MYRKGYSVVAVAKYYRVDGVTVWKALQRQGESIRTSVEASQLRGKHARFMLSQVDIERYHQGVSSYTLAQELEVTNVTILNALRRQGVAVHTAAQASHFRDAQRQLVLSQEALDRYAGGVGAPILAKELGMSNDTVLAALRRQGITIRTQKEASLLSSVPAMHAAAAKLRATGEMQKWISAGQQGIPREQWSGFTRDLYRRQAWYEWRKYVFRRDSFTCVLCGGHKPIVAHHILPKAKHPTLYYAVSNGVTLCAPCHDNIRGKEEEFVAKFREHVHQKRLRTTPT
jgi:biotin operon repressor